jgi:hypothetical protein
MIIFGIMFVVNGIAAHRGWRLMYFRLSSHVKTSRCPPLTFCLMEDICAVDGRGGKKFRTQAMARYHASPRFRTMLMQLLWLWAIPAILVGSGTIVGIYETNDNVAYGIGWGVPNVWAILWTWLTVKWVQRSLRAEKETWRREQGQSA